MARLPRLTVPGFPHHVIQRGNNRQPVFFDEADYRLFLDLLGQCAKREKVALHAYVLMPNHFHLLATPATEKGLPAMMQALGRRYVQYFNRRYRRSGTLWEGRYRATLIDSEAYLVTCMAYIDLNPVRANLVGRPLDYRWSSHGHYVGHRQDPLLTPHSLIWHLGNTPFAREAAYAQLIQQGLSANQVQTLTDASLKGWALGRPEFIDLLQKQTQRRVSRGQVGRPRRKSEPGTQAN